MNYRPYNFKELAKAIVKHGGYVISKPNFGQDLILHIVGVNGENDNTSITFLCNKHKHTISNTDELLRFFLWLDDNTPCGIKED